MPLKGKHIAVTGGTGGIGLPLCHALREQGAELTVISRSGEAIADAQSIKGDLSSPEGILAVAEELKLREIDILVQAAGIQHFTLLERQSPEDVLGSYYVNLLAPVLLAQAVLPQMKQRRSGHIVTIGSTFGSIPFAHFVTYSSAKAGLRAFSEALRREVCGHGIAVTHISPRGVDTPMNGAKMRELAQKTHMAMDAPEQVAVQIVQAIIAQRKEMFIGFPESLFARINAVLPRVVDKALQKNDRLAADLILKD